MTKIGRTRAGGGAHSRNVKRVMATLTKNLEERPLERDTVTVNGYLGCLKRSKGGFRNLLWSFDNAVVVHGARSFVLCSIQGDYLLA